MNDNNQRIFLTTTLPYVNSEPHVGHLFEFVLADAITRALKQHGHPVTFNVGLDEHGLKVWQKSQEQGITPQEHIAKLTTTWLEFCKKFHIGYDIFYKTSNPQHHNDVKIIWNRLIERGDLYKKLYSGNYCVGCESFKFDKELVGGKCPDHPNTELQYVEEEIHFFRLSKYKDSILHWLKYAPDFLQPENKITELENLITDAPDFPASRLKTRCPWGIEVPNDIEYVIYVWLDALTNYIFAAGYLTSDFNWDYVIQLCGSDNLRFQACIFQAILQSEGIKHTDKLLVHGTILDAEGKKMSKSEGNVVSPIEQLEKYGSDAVRYYLLGCLNTYGNSAWNEKDLVARFNSDICNDYGNLISRTLHLVDTKCSGELLPPDLDFRDKVIEWDEAVDELWLAFNVKDALTKLNELIKFGNKYINDTKPWSSDDYKQTLSNLYYLIKVAATAYAPVFPNREEEIHQAITNKKKVILFTKIEIELAHG